MTTKELNNLAQKNGFKFKRASKESRPEKLFGEGIFYPDGYLVSSKYFSGFWSVKDAKELELFLKTA